MSTLPTTTRTAAQYSWRRALEAPKSTARRMLLRRKLLRRAAHTQRRSHRRSDESEPLRAWPRAALDALTRLFGT